jgi:methionyl-tRNA formyltransferase
MYRVVFFGTEAFAVKILESLVNNAADFSVVGVVTQPARPVGRKQILTASPVAEYAAAHGLETVTPTTLKNASIAEQLATYAADVFVVAQYGMIIPQAILDIPAHGAINVHASLLPRHRGASPVHTAILSGDAITGVTFMKMDALMDHGDLFAEYQLPIATDDTTESLMNKLAEISAAHFPSDLKNLLDGTISATPQNHTDATGTKMLTRESGFVAWETMDAALIERMTRAFYPWPGVSIQVDDAIFKIIKAHTADAADGEPGTLHISGKDLSVATIHGQLIVDEIQPAGKSSMTGAQFANGYKQLDGKKCTTMSASSK